MAGESLSEELNSEGADVSQKRGSASDASGWMNEGSAEQMPVAGLQESVNRGLWFETLIGDCGLRFGLDGLPAVAVGGSSKG